MPPSVDKTLTPDLYELFLSYKKATTKVERWLAVTSDRSDNSARLTISEMQDAAQYISSKRIEVPDVIYHAFDKAITARAEVTNHFKGFFATETAKAKTSSHEHFTKILKAIFKSLCFDRLSFQNAKETTAPSLSTSNRFETLNSLPSESDAHSASGIDSTETNETLHEHCETFSEHAEEDGIKDDAVVQDFELHFALWDLQTTCAKVKNYWAHAAVGKMSIMLAGFLTNAAIANVAYRFRRRTRFFGMSAVISFDQMLEWSKSSTTGIPQSSGPSSTVVADAFIHELQAPLLCYQTFFEFAHLAPEYITGKPQDYITSLVGPLDSIERFEGEAKVFESLLMSIKQLPQSKEKDQHYLVMGFHPFIPTPDLHKYVGQIPTSATFVLRLIVESYKSWYTLQEGEERVPNSNLRLHALRFAQDVHKSVVRFRLSEPFQPRPGCDCSDCCGPGLMEHLRMLEGDLTTFMGQKRFDLYHQSPVVVGYQMMRILDEATTLGILFCNVMQYVGVALHLYNLLRQYDLIEEETALLEHLCDVLGHNIFRGPRPTFNFFSQYAVFQAMTYNFDHKSRTFAFGESKFHLRRFNPHTLSVMTGLNACGCSPFCNRWGPVWRGIDKRSRLTNEGVDKTADDIASHPLVCVLEPLESIVRSEWEGNFPVARINWFEVFSACTEILERISSAHCQDPRELTSVHLHLTRDQGFICGKDCVESFLGEAQQLERHEFKATCATEITLAVNAIRETFKNKKSADFLWNL